MNHTACVVLLLGMVSGGCSSSDLGSASSGSTVALDGGGDAASDAPATYDLPDANDTSVPTCPNASGVPPIGTWPAVYRQDAVPRGLACSAGARCSILIHDCANDWPAGSTSELSTYGCACVAGSWSCGVTGQGGTLCPDYFQHDAGFTVDALADAADGGRPGCRGDTDCAAGTTCNAATACLPPPGCDFANGGCPAVCYGYCVP